MRAIVVDDNPIMRLYCRRILNRKNWEVTEAGNAKESLKIFRPGVFSLALVDINLGHGPDGISVALAFRAKDANLKILTMSAEFEHERRVRKSGVGPFLLKPFPPERIYPYLNLNDPPQKN